MPAIARPNDRPSNRPSYLMRHCVLSAYPGDLLNGVSGVQYYGARVLASSYPGDVIMMHPDLEDSPQLTAIQSHYKRIGLETADQFIFDQRWDVARDHPLELNAFHFGAEAHAVKPDAKFAHLAENLNDKNNFIQLCQKLGIPVPGTVFYDRIEDFSITDDRAPYPVFVKAAVSASGMHVIKASNDEELLAAVKMMPGRFQVQEGLSEQTVFCNIQYTEAGGKFRHGPLTRQKLVDNQHAGNSFPAEVVGEDDVQPRADKIAHYMFSNGMKNTWAFDVAVTPGRGALFIEANPRWNGASYYSNPADRLGARAWEGQYVRPKHGDLRFIFRNHEDWEYSQNRGNGIVIINWGPILGSPPKIGLLVIGDSDQRQRLLRTFESRYCNV